MLRAGKLVYCRVEKAAFTIVEIAGKCEIAHSVTNMKVGNRGAEKDVAGIMECQPDIRCDVCYTAIVEGYGMPDIGLDFLREEYGTLRSSLWMTSR